MRRRLTILGSTGSIGRQALEVVRACPERFELVGLAAGSDARALERQARQFSPAFLALESDTAAPPSVAGSKVLKGAGSAAALASVPADVVLNGIVGFAGLAATVAALEAGNRVALANKESLVAGGEWVMELAGEDLLLPVDSEHSAIFQCLLGRDAAEVSALLLTASGGPFFDADRKTLQSAGPEDALDHPTWRMGPKITVDSATMMNKGLEVIEAHHLFGVPYKEIRVAVHRQSVVHGGAILTDGSVVVHAALPDMRLPISFGILYPETRPDLGAREVPLFDSTWTFEAPRDELFRCLPLAVEAGRAGGAYPVVLNAANEVAVEAFLAGRLRFLEIADLIESVLESAPDLGEMNDLEAIAGADGWARSRARSLLGAPS